MNPIHIADLDHVVLRITDLDGMLHFYCHVLGCSVERRQEEIGLIQLRAGNALIDLVPVDSKLGRMGGAAPTDQGRNMDHFCLRLDSFDEPRIRDYLKGQSVKVGPVSLRYGAQGQGPSVYVTDPEGNVVELKGSLTSNLS
jgi:catechol 2,3-dioxygenase-like lactoylglutathione lyase family enzyme